MTYKLSGFEVSNEVQKMVDEILNVTEKKYFSALVVGWRESSYNDLFHNLKIAGYTDIEVIDIYKPNVEKYKLEGVRGIDAREMDVRNAYAVYGEESKDVVIFQHGPEHLEKDEGFEVIAELKKMAKAYVVIETPISSHQDDLFGNPNEQHLSEWKRNDYNTLGFVTSPGENGRHIIGIWMKPE